MTTMLLTLGAFAMAMTLMAMGVILGGMRLQGSCGGTGKDCLCELEKRKACNLLKHRSGTLTPDQLRTLSALARDGEV